MDEVIGRRIDNVTIAMVETLLKEYKAIEDKYETAKNNAVIQTRYKLLSTLASIPFNCRTQAEDDLYRSLRESDIPTIGSKETRNAELDDVTFKIVQLISDAVKGKFIIPLDRHREFMYVKEVTLHGSAPNYTVWLNGVTLRVNGVVNQDGVVEDYTVSSSVVGRRDESMDSDEYSHITIFWPEDLVFFEER